jgi:F-type H+-transporting ATPase subunit gamma
MASLKEVRGRIQSVNSTQQITKAMKMVAAAKLRRAQDNIIQMRPYAQKLAAIIQNVSADLDQSELDNPYAKEKAAEKILIVAISSDRGLCGAFNTNVFRGVNSLIAEDYKVQAAKGNVTILPVGRKALDYARRKGAPSVADYSNTISAPTYDNVKKVAEFVMNRFVSGEFDRVILVYNEFKNVATQILKKDQFLPVLPPKAEGVSSTKTDYIFEPNKADIFRDLIPETLKIQFYKAVLESRASEEGARMTAMDKATENAGELLKELKLTYNRTRQAAITKEILEIVGGAEALAAK